ncbi:Short-chain dehydrogenase/reductase family 16C member 6-like protein [Dinothrombium tinctorium]|uniref:Short-chain dehydrogenase/reductase 3 n=1 Tax=Dinothrombium tinctorium TaxID=1965070 RepID=A0A3S3PGB5_9ACAR|nr:Short-chain dehydrogenase/reductase family 16C member 6-like protein [Dinothrombium tinctorium]RWS11854.1 Short-chain dehydrogenase/reductase family 16C member 6-like protein [Dinothrombium tinctorium]RWS12131.1 Short-chain dehydrogenase/reductase family 16C member 6-like protein [Dinothrombium tinctorium]RWS12357.1 Short-chain dehydrogenase/reductase family 16C member 6-like protein [Dinothrombium tinctorium]
MFVPKKWRFKDISGDIVLITGAGSGLGRQLALKLASFASHLVLWDINECGLLETAKLLKKSAAQCSYYMVDVSDSRMVYATAAKVRNEVGKVTILINNAGIVCGKRFLELKDEEIIKTFKVNTFSHYWTCKAFIPEMIATNKGHIVSVASIASYSGLNQLSDYCGSKAAAAKFFESLVLETKDAGYDGIHFTLVCPYLMSTGMFAGAESSVFGSLSPETVAERTVESILTNEEFVVMPKILRLLISIRSLVSIKAQYMLYRFVGFDNFMSNFNGNRQR